MLLSRTKAAVQPVRTPSAVAVHAERKFPRLDEFIAKRDFSAAVALLEIECGVDKPSTEILLWLGYSYYHLGDYRKAMKTYEKMLQDPKCDHIINVYLGACYFFLGMYKEAETVAAKGPKSKLTTRLNFHVSHKLGKEDQLLEYHQELEDVLEDQMTLASIHFLRSHYQEAIDVYKRLLLEYQDYAALNVYIALCYYKLDYFDVSQELLSIYLQKDPTSITAVNLKACNHFKLYNGKAAEAEMRTLSEKVSPHFRYAEDLIKHNMVVFRGGEGALQVLPSLIDVLPEARLNMVIYFLQHDDVDNAMELMKEFDPTNPQEYVIKAVTFSIYSTKHESSDHQKLAQQYFHLIGSATGECDTIQGRQCMASSFILQNQHEDAMIYLNSIKTYLSNDDAFNVNYGQIHVALGHYTEAEEALAQVTSDKYLSDYNYLSHLAHCYVMNQKGNLAWELYLRLDASVESFNLLHFIANDCYSTGQYFYAAKAFDVLERIDANQEYWQGKRGACVGVFKNIVEGKEDKELLTDVIAMLRSSGTTEADKIMATMRLWGQKNHILI